MTFTFSDFLAESYGDEMSIEEAAKIINERSSEWKKFIGGFATDKLNWLIYRGMKVRWAEDCVIKSPRSNRRPLSTSQHIHELTDKYFEKTFGKKFRSQSIFVSRSKQLAEYYGDVYAIFPLDQVSFAWSEEVEDYTLSSDQFVKRTLGTFRERDEPTKEITYEELEKFMDSLDYHCDDDSLKTLYQKYRSYEKFELMIMCDEYVAVRAEVLPKLLNLLN